MQFFQMSIKGKVKTITEVEEKGNFRVRKLIIETMDKYPQVVALDFTQNNGEKDSGALYISNVQVYTLDYSCKGSVQIDHCNFTNNSLNTLIAHSGIAINIYGRITNGMEGIHFSTQNKFSITRSYFNLAVIFNVYFFIVPAEFRSVLPSRRELCVKVNMQD